MAFNWPHVHLVLNHFPVIGTIFGFVMLVAARQLSNEDVKKAALYTFAVTGVFTVATVLAGDQAADAVKGIACVADNLIKRHDNFATYSMSGSIVLGLLSAVFLYQGRGRRVNKQRTMLLIILSFIVCIMMGWTAELGGRIHHEELRPGYTFTVHQGSGD